ncbi:membrane protein insertion efficiency factor YidD [Geopsychrobacter electrodiphilus]|uniref:membrane protein insertion efficiency factor YidD n=1 Tax=Geopsychrobacter electrodiphilus TaxID=225196 RepID=UPI0009FBFD0A|nr:membrane protein insertion efficiency factor YidD [Geopsychrobacter electrodiphilus]
MFFKRLIIFLIDIYRHVISPLYPPICRFYPSCSNYARQSLIEHGLLTGSILTIRRISKCHPFHPGGFDPVPPRDSQV